MECMMRNVLPAAHHVSLDSLSRFIAEKHERYVTLIAHWLLQQPLCIIFNSIQYPISVGDGDNN